jgi:hypothetical protein
VEETRRWLDKIDLDELTERVARRLLTTAQPILRGQLRQFELLGSISDDSVLSRRPGSSCFVFRTANRVKVLLSDRELEMPAFVAEAMEEIARRDRLTAKDLHSLLDRDSALVLLRRLVREGLLEVSREG